MAGKIIEVLNFGVSGYSTAQEFLTLRNRVWKYRPDLVLVAVYTARDVFNNLRQLNNAGTPEQSPYYVYRGGRLTLDDSYTRLPQMRPWRMRLEEFEALIAERSTIYQAILRVRRSVRKRSAKTVVEERARLAGVANLDEAIYIPPSSDALTRAWTVTEDLLKMIRDEVRSRGVRFRVVALANRQQVHPDPEVRASLMKRLGTTNLFYPDLRICEFGERERIPMTLLAYHLAEYAQKHKIFLNGFLNSVMGEGHWNELGHELAGSQVAADICKELSGEIDVTSALATRADAENP